MDATAFGHYQLQELIGRGGMGEVYRAYDIDTDRVVALKVLPPHLAGDATFQERFRRESQIAAGLNEPHVVPIHGFGEIDGRLYLDMRLIEGNNLGTMLKDSAKPLGAAFGVNVVEQVAAALDAAHGTGLIHRDIKPSNIFVTEHDFVYLIDFGLARTADESALTTSGSTLGTMAYMAPERLEGEQADQRSDIYALTCVLYECLTGSRPYPGGGLEQQIAQHMMSPPPRPSVIDRKLVAFDDVIAKGMAKDPDKRYQKAGELAAAARRALTAPVRVAGGSRHAAQPTRASARWSGKAVALVGAAVLLVAGCAFGAWQWWGAHQRSNASAALPPGAVASIAATVPADIRATGRLVAGVNVPYAPNEFKNSQGQIVGFDVDLLNAVAKTLGLATDYREAVFDDIIPSVQHGNINVGMSSFTDTVQRQSMVDFVTYFQAGTLWAQRPGSPIDPGAACGLRVGVVAGSIQESKEIPAKSDACTAAGVSPVNKIVYPGQDEVTAALIAGKVDAMSADSPVTGFAIKLSNGALVPAGDVFDSAPYGWPVAKGSRLAESLRQALEHVMQTGEYRTIATTWGVDKGMINKPAVNGATG